MNENIDNLMIEASKLKNFMAREGGATEQEILELEKKFSIEIPGDYRYFLKKFGFGFWFGGGPLGLPHEDFKFKKYKDVSRTTEYYKDLFNSDNRYQAVPNKGVVIDKYDGGGYYFLFSNDSNRPGEVGLFLTETWGKEVEKFNSFTDYLSYLVKGEPDSIAV